MERRDESASRAELIRREYAETWPVRPNREGTRDALLDADLEWARLLESINADERDAAESRGRPIR
jgi:hypothetical protein